MEAPVPATERWPRLLRRPGTRTAAHFGLLFALVAAVWSPFLRAPRVDNRYWDWTFRTDYLGYELNAWRHDHQFPFWVTSGRYEQLRVKGLHDYFANPETDVLSIVPPLAAWTDYLTAVKLALLAYLALGVYGCQRLLKTLVGKADLVPSAFLALLALCNGAIVAHVIVGHTQFITLATFPLVLALLLEAYQPELAALARARRAAIAGALLALAYYSGNTHPLFYFLLMFLGLLPVLLFAEAPRGWRASLGTAAIAGVAFLTLAAFKLLPGVIDLRHYHTDYLISFPNWRLAFDNIVDWWSATDGQFSHEQNMYVGWFGLGLLGIGLLGLRERRLRPVLISVGLFGALMFLQPGSKYLELPFLRTQGALTRIRLVTFLGLATASGVQLARFQAWLELRQRSWAFFLRGALLAAAIGFAIDLSRANVARHVDSSCRDALPVCTGPFDEAPELVLGPGVVGSVTPTDVRADTIGYRFALRAPGLLVARGVRATPQPHLAIEGDGELTAVGDSLAVRVNKPSGGFQLRFRDPVSSAGLAVALASAFACLILLCWQRRPLPNRGARHASP